MTYQPNPDAPIASERHPREYDLMCHARNVFEATMTAYIKACKEAGFTCCAHELRDWLADELHSEVGFSPEYSEELLGESYVMSVDEINKLKEEIYGTRD